MHVMLINTLYSPHAEGGAARSVQELGEVLVALGHRVRLLTLALSSDDITSETINGVEVRRLDFGTAARPFIGATTQLTPIEKLAWQSGENRRIRVGALVRREVADFSPDVVHTNNIAGFGVEAWRAVAGVPLVHTMRDYYLSCVRSQMFRKEQLCETQCFRCKVFKAPVRYVRRRPDVWVGVSTDIVDRHRRVGVIGEEQRSAVIYNWPHIDHALVRPRTGASDLVFGLFGRVGEDKGTWLAVEAFQRIDPRLRGGARLVIGGGASTADRDRLARLSQQDPAIEYLGGVLQPEAFYSSIDVALVPSRWFEPFGRVAAEARLTGRAVIASRIGGLPEALQAFGGDGTLLDEYTSVTAWTAAMTAAIERAPLRNTPAPVDGDSGGSEVPHSVAEQYLAVYRSAGA